MLRAAAAADGAGLALAPHTLERFVAEAAPVPEPWPTEVRDGLVALLGAGAGAVPVFEALDQAGLVVRLLPEWAQVRSKPQRNAYHRFTLDRHLYEAAAHAAPLARRVARPDLLLLGALLHDIGKGWPGDHTEVGVELVGRIGPRLGLPLADRDPGHDGAAPSAAAGCGQPARPGRPGDHGGGRDRGRRPGHPR